MIILLDIEGTTTSISFVYERLFPYVKAHVGPFLRRRWADEDVADAVSELRELSRRDVASGKSAFEIPEGVNPAIIRDAVEKNVLKQMATDRKTTALKLLQGLIWRDGYASGELKGHVYGDVLDAFRIWQSRGDRIYIYSSGSVAAQKLLFRHAEVGDLTAFLDGHFDTTSGPKKEATSYQTISDAIGVDPGECLFLTDDLYEARAARETGMKVVITIRPGNHDLPEHDFDTANSFALLC
jgi:enolase-phosphatase E1